MQKNIDKIIGVFGLILRNYGDIQGRLLTKASESQNKLKRNGKKMNAKEMVFKDGRYLLIENPKLFFEKTGGESKLSPLQTELIKLALFYNKKDGKFEPTVPTRSKMYKLEYNDWGTEEALIERLMPEFHIKRLFEKEKAENQLKMAIVNETFDSLITEQMRERWEVVFLELSNHMIEEG